MGVLRTLGRPGDTRIAWDPGNPKEVEFAKQAFEDAVGKGFAAFEVEAFGRKGCRTHEFDEKAKEIILVPPAAGG